MQRLKTWRVRRAPFHKRFPSRSGCVLRQVDKRIAVDRSNQFIYFRIPKCANSTVCYQLARHSDASVGSGVAAKGSFLRGSDLRKREVAQLSNKYFLFTFVRNPFSRVASAYLDKVARLKGKQTKLLKNYYGVQREVVSFREFCRYLEKYGREEDPHWFPQSFFVPVPTDQLHFIGYFENFDSDLNTLHCKLRLQPSKEGIDRRWDSHRTDAHHQLAQLYCSETIDIVRRLYRDDFQRFGYAMDPTWIKSKIS